MTDRVLYKRPGVTVTRDRALQVGGIVVLLVLGMALPYVTISYFNDTVELVRESPRLFAASGLLGGMDPTFLPSFRPETVQPVNVALNLAAAGPGVQELGTIVALITCWGLFFDEINRLLWWPLHLSSYVLLIAPVLGLIGVYQLHRNDVAITIGPACFAGLLAGVLILVVTLRAYKRIDTYGGV